MLREFICWTFLGRLSKGKLHHQGDALAKSVLYVGRKGSLITSCLPCGCARHSLRAAGTPSQGNYCLGDCSVLPCLENVFFSDLEPDKFLQEWRDVFPPGAPPGAALAAKLCSFCTRWVSVALVVHQMLVP